MNSEICLAHIEPKLGRAKSELELVAQLALPSEFAVRAQSSNCFMLPAQPPKSLADGLARCQLSSAGGVAARQIVERSPLHCWKRGRAKPRAVTVLAKLFPIQVMARGSKHWISQRLRNDAPDCPNRMIWGYFWVAPRGGRNWEATKV